MVRLNQVRCETSQATLRSYNSLAYAWDEPCLPHRLALHLPGPGGHIGTHRLDEVKEYPPVLLPATPQVGSWGMGQVRGGIPN